MEQHALHADGGADGGAGGDGTDLGADRGADTHAKSTDGGTDTHAKPATYNNNKHSDILPKRASNFASFDLQPKPASGGKSAPDYGLSDIQSKSSPCVDTCGKFHFV